MSEGVKPPVDTSSSEFKKGVEAGLNSTEDTKNWKAGNDLGQALKDEPQAPLSGSDAVTTPLFMRRSAEGVPGNAQDEKDATEE